MKKIFICVLIVMISLVSGCGNKKQQNAVTIKEEKVVPVKAKEVTTGIISKDYRYNSTFLPQEKVMVVPKVQGEVTKVCFDIGENVNKNDILFSIDKDDIKKQVDDLSKQLKSINLTIDLQKLALESAKGSSYIQQLNQIEQQYKASEIAYNDAKKSLEDITKLYETGATSKNQYDQVESGFKQAELSYNTAKEGYELYVNELSKQNIDTQENQYKQVLVKKEQLLLAYNNAVEMLSDAEVKSPIDGIVSQRGVEPNQMLNAQVIPFTIVKMDKLIVEVGVSEDLVSKIKVEDKVKVSLENGKEVLEGKITAISPAADERTMSYLTKIKVDNKEHKYKPGMFVDVVFETNKIKDALIIPIDSVINYEDKNYVFILDENNRAKKIEVKVGIDNGEFILVKEGLKEGDQIIVEGQNYIEDNTSVNLVE